MMMRPKGAATNISALKDIRSRTGTHDSHSVNSMVRDIPIGDIQIKSNVRQDYKDIEELAASIRQHGLLQMITVYKDGDEYFVKTGHRRFLAYTLLYKDEPERFNSIRCILSDADNLAIVQLVENVQRVDLSQIDLCNALCALREQGMSNRQIALAMGKKEGYVKNLFMGVNEVTNNNQLESLIKSHAGVTLQDVTETKGIPDEQTRIDLLKQRGNGEINRTELRKKAKALKSDCPAQAEIPQVSTIPEVLPSTRCTAATIAKERLDQYILDKVEVQWDDLALWEFYTWLLEQAKRHAVNRSGFISNEYKADQEQAKKRGKPDDNNNS
ncbi:hypothetical protein FACS189473_2580 [Spirochaetia bacterium]|nr:hypothetical protein FACS189473_2580 [Spirochaetia bacterium]